MSEPTPPSPPKRPYDSLFTPHTPRPATFPAAPPAAVGGPTRPYDSLFTPGHRPTYTPPPPPPAAAGGLRRAWHAFKYAGPPRLPPITAKFASYLPLFLLLWKANEWTMNEIMVYQHPALVADAHGQLQWGGRASLFGFVGLVSEQAGGVAYARIKWALNAADIVGASEDSRLGVPRVLRGISDAAAWALFKVLPAPLAAGLTPFASRPWDESSRTITK